MGAIIFAGLLCTAVGLSALLWGLRVLGDVKRASVAASSWPEATAVIDSVAVQTIPRTLLGSQFLAKLGRGLYAATGFVDGRSDTIGPNLYEPQIRYRFQVGGHSFHGSRVEFGNLKQVRNDDARRIADSYDPGGWVKIRYNPQDPRDSVIRPVVGGRRSQYQFQIIVGILMLAMAILCFVLLATGNVR